MVEEYSKLAETLKDELKEALLGYEYIAEKRAFVALVDRGSLIRALELLGKISGGELHLTSINGADLGGHEMELTYFIWLLPQKIRVLVKTRLPKDDLKVQSAVNVMPAAILYEREVHEMLGVVFEGHPKLERLFLPEDWPEGVYPLRRD
ncbi:MAG: NADH-quinone oxidoreductase subunit C [Candidatus Nezhaarchaeales archaeon]